MVAQGTFRYPGIEGVLSASVTVSLGINPSVTTVSVPPLTGLQPRGTATWRYNNGVIRSFPDSIVDFIQIDRAGGFTTWNVSILDRRWAWTTGEISGEYNTRKKGVIIPAREKTPRELATLCLEAMNETGFDVSQLPNDDRPLIQWDVEQPAKALAELCDMYGCGVALRIDNTVGIVKLGEGADFPAGWLTNDLAIDPANVPKKIRVVTAPTAWQIDLKLKPIAYENDGTLNADGTMQKDGTVKAWDAVSYKPSTGWIETFGDDFEFGDDDEPLTKANRSLALGTILQAFQVERPTEDIDGMLVELEELAQILPLIPDLLDTTGTEGNETPIPAYVWGRFYDGEGLKSNSSDNPALTNLDYSSLLKYKGSFSIDAETGIVTFSEPIYVVNDDGDIQLPDLWLRCTINLRDKDNRSAQRQFKELTVDPSSPSLPQFIVRDDIQPEWRQETGGAWTSNESDIETEADYYLAQELRNYQSLQSANATYAGFIALNTDGAIRQIQYSIAGDGKAMSSVSRNGEFSRIAVSYDEARRRQKQAAALERDARQRKKPKQRKRRE
jgi:hypothetical protein